MVTSGHHKLSVDGLRRLGTLAAAPTPWSDEKSSTHADGALTVKAVCVAKDRKLSAPHLLIVAAVIGAALVHLTFPASRAPSRL